MVISVGRLHLANHFQRKQLILALLNSTATKRETKNYFQKYQQIDLGIESPRPGNLDQNGAVLKNPLKKVLRVSIIKIRSIGKIARETLDGIGLTIVNLIKLGVSPVIVIDNYDLYSKLQRTLEFGGLEKKLNSRFYKLQAIIKEREHVQKLVRSVPVDSLFEVDSNKGVSMSLPQLIVDHLSQGVIPIVYPIGYDLVSASNIMLPSDLVVENIALNLDHYNRNYVKDGLGLSLLSIEKIILIDPNGGIPSLERLTSSHVLVNLKQEFETISTELQQGFLKPLHKALHILNLTVCNDILKNLPDSAGAIITTPQLAAINDFPKSDILLPEVTQDNLFKEISIAETYEEDYKYHAADKEEDEDSLIINQHGQTVDSFKVKNPIIYNILTDRPLISPSLPVYLRNTPLLSTTVLRKGTDVKTFKSDSPKHGLDLVDMDSKGDISLKKLKELIDDSFNKKLDLDHYLNRVNGKVAGLIIAGDYEGGAIITWEETSPGQYIPYLDKLAVKRSVQGTFSVADIVFKVMVNNLFPAELIWRSRTSNPVNKWYHERSNGSLNIPGTIWRTFWVGSNTRNEFHLKNYIKVCKSIEPSWST